MKITRRQLKRLIREQVALMAPAGGQSPAGTWEELAASIDRLKQSDKLSDVEFMINNRSLSDHIADTIGLTSLDISHAGKLAEIYIPLILEVYESLKDSDDTHTFKINVMRRIGGIGNGTMAMPSKYDLGIMIRFFDGFSSGTEKMKSGSRLR